MIIALKKTPHVYRLFASCPGGLDGVLRHEIESMGVKVVDAYPGGIDFLGTLEIAYQACLSLRTASRMMLLLKEAKQIFEPEELYVAVQSIDWTRVFDPNCTFAIHFTESEKKGRRAPLNLQFWALKAKDAIVDQFRERLNERPSVDRKDPDITLRFHIHDQILKIYLDLSGPGLHERGYRSEVGDAPIKENLAAGLLLLAGWDQKSKEGFAFYDPFCGSGTFLIEAAMIAADIAPGLLRTQFGFYAWKEHSPELFESVIERLKAKQITDRDRLPKMFGSDVDTKMVRIAEANLANAGLEGLIEMKQARFEETAPPAEKGLIVTNPPYGVRLDEIERLVAMYGAMGSTLKHQYKGWSCGVITSEKKHIHAIGLKPSKKWALHNGPLEAQYSLIELY